MKTTVLFSAIAVVAGSLIVANAASQDEVKGAAKALATKGYSWKQTTEIAGGGGGGGGGGGMRPGPIEGKADKDGCICVSMTRGDNTTEAFLKGEKGAIKTADGWQSFAEAAPAAGGGGGGQGGGRGRGMVVGMLRNLKAPAVQAEDLAGKTKELSKSGDVYSGDLTEEAVKALLTFGGRRGGQAPETSNAKGSVKFWVKDGVLTKYEVKVEGTRTINGEERNIGRTTTVEIKDVGTTKFEVPAAAKEKLEKLS